MVSITVNYISSQNDKPFPASTVKVCQVITIDDGCDPGAIAIINMKNPR